MIRETVPGSGSGRIRLGDAFSARPGHRRGQALQIELALVAVSEAGTAGRCWSGLSLGFWNCAGAHQRVGQIRPCAPPPITHFQPIRLITLLSRFCLDRSPKRIRPCSRQPSGGSVTRRSSRKWLVPEFCGTAIRQVKFPIIHCLQTGFLLGGWRGFETGDPSNSTTNRATQTRWPDTVL